ncbi:MAG: GAF and ANTAR domain-containing protein [Humibacillus sp.]|nr:GAF and ANTAR domain-containing protein [Humibacillus sp.]
MYDRDRLLPTLSEFARTILGPYDLTSMLEDLAEAATDVLRLVGCGVSLITDDRITYAATVPGRLAALERAQERAQAGPCVQACRSGKIVAVADLGLRSQDWGVYCAAGAEAGVLAVAGIPMTLGETRVGALNLYADSLREWSSDDLAIAQVLADMATGYLINASEANKQQQLNGQLQHALDSRVIIEQAKGMVAATHGVTVQAAFGLIRAHARSHNASLRLVAEAIVHLGLRIAAEPAPPGSGG